MITVVIIGFGNVGQHLFHAFRKSKEVKVLQVCSPSLKEGFKGKTQFINKLSEVTMADVYIFAVKDDLIKVLSKDLPVRNRLLVHTSGTVSIDALNGKNRKGVFYPLQSFSTDSKINFKKIPICVEAENPEDMSLLRKLAEAISKKVVDITSEERKRIHLAAVWVNNFSNHMYHLASDYLREHNLEFDLLKPLILETAKKIEKLSPKDAQTGPAKRNDKNTLAAHLAMLKDPKEKEIYKLLTESIQKKFNQNQ
jgi:predicted short-subunit dehydrogenase-like oxidoreductase (DUF2520 family)